MGQPLKIKFILARFSYWDIHIHSVNFAQLGTHLQREKTKSSFQEKNIENRERNLSKNFQLI